MADGATYGKMYDASSFAHMQRMGPSQSNMQQFLFPFAWKDVVFVFEDFLHGGSLEVGTADFEEGLWVGDTSANGTDFNIIATQLSGGVARGVTGAVAGDTVAMWSEDNWQGDKNCGMEVRYKIDDIDAQQFEVGWSDPLTDEKLTALNDIDTPTITNGAADVALIARDTAQTLKTLAFITDGSTSNMNTTKTNLGTRNNVNAEYASARIQLIGNTSLCFLLDTNSRQSVLLEQAGHGDTISSQIEGGVLVHPRILMEAGTTSAVTVDVDYWALWQNRI